MEINERIKYLRKKVFNVTQQEFAEKIKISRSNLGNIETGEVTVTERVIYLICEKFNVNKTWLCTGEGEPLVKRTRSQEVAAFTNEAMEELDESFKKRFLLALSKLDERDWETIEKLTKELTKETE